MALTDIINKARLARAGKLLALQFLYVLMLFHAIIISGACHRMLQQSYTNELVAFFCIVGGSVLFFLMHVLQPMGIVSYFVELANVQNGLMLWCVPIFVVTLVHIIRNRGLNRWLKVILSVVLFATTLSWMPIVAVIYLLCQVKEFSRSTRVAACVAAVPLFLLHAVPNNFPARDLTSIFLLYQLAAVVFLGLMLRDTIRNSRVSRGEQPSSAPASDSSPVTQSGGATAADSVSDSDSDSDASESSIAVIKLPQEKKEPEPK